MAENESTTKVEDHNKENSPEETSEELLSLDNLDSILAEEDPEFAKSLGEIGPIDPNSQIDSDGTYTVDDEKKLWAKGSALRQKILKVFPFLPSLSYKIKMQRSALRLKWIDTKEKLRVGIKAAGPATLKAIKAGLGKIKDGIGAGLAAFKEFSLVKKLAFVGLVAATVVACIVGYKAANHKLLPEDQDLFLPSLEEWAQAKYLYDTKEEQMESFYDSTRTSQNMIEMKKIVANIRPSKSSGPNPMAAMEFYVEGTVAEVVVEIKDREPEMKDLFLRTIEEMNYDQMASGEGKQLLCDRLRKDINKVLTTGKVRRIFIKTAIVKP
ncbi:flagellar basal body-associated FliL family protein [Bdellovibrio sp. NC01]|uniref:flagellar basal body-associated FliL family protein n=1 Tax=Bdellovibrio sp. NC01 TaxID=2220073 RepID=UPI00115BF8B7|nr:flagellar basal body-associated FliL family protein [Bdellovibrio sp. NC01]QDK36796.1 flagellar protein required for flagellar formation [Bdellovibrio sp. NC01]